MNPFIHSSDFRSWGGTRRATHSVAHPRATSELLTLLERARREQKPILAVGLGGSYGDSCLNANGALIVMTGLQRITHFDPVAGTIKAEAGITLGELTKLTLPYGLLPPVLPGTEHVTLGGAIANDVHGKNHLDAGTFGCHVRRLELLRSDGSVVELAPGDRLFAATIGGLGLTGIITEAEFSSSRFALAAWMWRTLFLLTSMSSIQSMKPAVRRFPIPPPGWTVRVLTEPPFAAFTRVGGRAAKGRFCSRHKAARGRSD